MGMRLDGNNHARGIQNRNRFRRFPLCFRLKVGKLVGNVDTWLETVEYTDKFDSGCACAVYRIFALEMTVHFLVKCNH